jgi:hypothetical protein
MDKPDFSESSERRWLYWAVILIALVLVILEIIGKGAAWTNIGALVFIAAAIFLRPGGLTRGR